MSTPSAEAEPPAPLRSDPLEAEAYREIVLRHGTKVTLDQVLDTLIEIGWTAPPARRRTAPKLASPQEQCPSCHALVVPGNATGLCRLPSHMCPYKAAHYP